VEAELDKLHYIVGHVDLLAGRKLRGMARWRDQLFVLMASNTQDATAFYQIPAAQAMKVGLQVGI
jgi:KUP system potassium uptake protein